LSLFQLGAFKLHSGQQSGFKIECDELKAGDWSALAYLILRRYSFREVYGVPRGGLALAEQLRPYRSVGPILIVDDVLTTGTSMETERARHNGDCVGVVVFARGPCPHWIDAIFQMDNL
jgi:hypothetical protein